MDRKLTEQELLSRFDDAIENGHIFAVYQPKINHSTGRMIGAEALMRWKDPEFGMQYPDNFIPVLEKNGLIPRADLAIFEMVCRFQRSCLDSSDKIVPISVNMSRYDVFNRAYVDEIERLRKKYDIPVEFFHIEVTETSAIGGMELMLSVLNKLHGYGYIVEMDDFGSGYSSLNVLKDLPVDVIKLDMRFFGGGVGGRGGMIINAVVHMAQWLGTPVIAEGVETLEQAEYLKSIGCKHIQGYLYSRPVSQEEFRKKLGQLEHEPISSIPNIKKEIDAGKFWDPASMETLIFNSFVGGAVIFTYRYGSTEILRVNKKYIREIGMNMVEQEILESDLFSGMDEKNRQEYTQALQRAIESGEEEVCETWRTVCSKTCGKEKICLRSHLRMIGRTDMEYLFYATVNNITAEKKQYRELYSSERRFRFASDQANIYAWEYDIATKRMYPCFRCMRDLNFPPVIENYPEPAIEAGVFPPDYADMYRDWHKQLEKGVDHLEATIPLTVGRIPFHVRYTLERDETGKPLKAYGSATLVVDENKEEEKSAPSSEQEPASFVSLALALANNYSQIYVVNTENDSYEEFSVSDNDKELIRVSHGSDFFADSVKNVPKLVYSADQGYFLKMLKKDYMLSILNDGQPFFLTYRLMKKGVPRFHSFKALLGKDGNIVIGVQDIDEQKRCEALSETYSHIAGALASRYEVIYYINIDTNDYSIYNSSAQYEKLGTTKQGEDFFRDCVDDIRTYIYKEDVDYMLGEMSKENIVRKLSQNAAYSLRYRQQLSGRYQYMTMTIVRPKDDDHHVVVGVMNSDAQVRREQSMEAENKTFGNIAKALAKRYEIIYRVNIETNEYMEYSASEKYTRLGPGAKGKDFFAESRSNIKNEIYEDDVPLLSEALKKENILKTLDEYGKTFINYRLLIDGKPQYMTLYAIRPKEDSSHMIIAVANVDASKRMEIAYHNAMNLANKDALTSVKNKRAYVHTEMEMDERIKKSEQPEFAVAVCDVNCLKEVNDTRGHSAGDTYIKEACRIICTVFTNSPVFRIGGDEFAVIITGDDYKVRGELMKTLESILEDNLEFGMKTIAVGISEFDRENDIRVQDVFERADALMYKDKERCKRAAESDK